MMGMYGTCGGDVEPRLHARSRCTFKDRLEDRGESLYWLGKKRAITEALEVVQQANNLRAAETAIKIIRNRIIREKP